MVVSTAPELAAGEGRWLLTPNASLDQRAARWITGVVALSCLAVAIPFVAAGFWPVLPFAGLEVLVVGLGLRHVCRRQLSTAQLISISADQVVVKTLPGDKLFRASTCWLRLEARADHRLYFGYAGQWIELGSFLGAEERQSLIRQLRTALNSTGVQANQAETLVQALDLS